MGKTFKRSREDIYEGEYDANAFENRKSRELCRSDAKRQKAQDHESIDEIEEEQGFGFNDNRRFKRTNY